MSGPGAAAAVNVAALVPAAFIIVGAALGSGAVVIATSMGRANGGGLRLAVSIAATMGAVVLVGAAVVAGVVALRLGGLS